MPALNQPDGLHPNAEGVKRIVARLLPLVEKLLAEVPAGMRLFVGLDLPWELRQRVAMLAGGGIPGARWVPPENYHVTLRFIGEAPRYMAEEIDHALAALKAPRLHADAGRRWHLRQRRPQPVAVGRRRAQPAARSTAEQDRDGAAALRPRAGAAAVPAAYDAGAAGQCARRRRSRAFVQAHNLFRADPVPMEHFTLFSSLLGKDQPVYTAEVEYELEARRQFSKMIFALPSPGMRRSETVCTTP